MDQLGETVDLPFFYSCIWRIMISNPGLRPPALNYLLRRLPKMAGKEGKEKIVNRINHREGFDKETL